MNMNFNSPANTPESVNKVEPKTVKKITGTPRMMEMFTEEINKCKQLPELILKLSMVDMIQSKEGKEVATKDLIVLLTDMLHTSTVVDLENKEKEYLKYFTSNYNLREKVKELVDEKVARLICSVK